jgi:malonyl CoA-acyl carrier protein transacylase
MVRSFLGWALCAIALISASFVAGVAWAREAVDIVFAFTADPNTEIIAAQIVAVLVVAVLAIGLIAARAFVERRLQRLDDELDSMAGYSRGFTPGFAC